MIEASSSRAGLHGRHSDYIGSSRNQNYVRIAENQMEKRMENDVDDHNASIVATARFVSAVVDMAQDSRAKVCLRRASI